MTLEEAFFKKYEIEPKHIDSCKIADEYWNNEELANKYFSFERYMKSHCPEMDKTCYSTCKYAYDLEEYPKITDEHYLKFICLLNKCLTNFLCAISDLKELKEEILLNMMNKSYLFKEEVQKMFKEAEND